jgi:hypothetical protein
LQKKASLIYDYGGHWGLFKPKNWTQVHIITKFLNFNDNALIIPFQQKKINNNYKNLISKKKYVIAFQKYTTKIK